MKKVIIIAEAGVNHNGDFNRAIQLIDAAAEAGADYVKFQTFKAENIVNPTAKKAQYQIQNMAGEEDTQFGMLKKLEMQEDWYPHLIGRCNEKGIKFLSTGFDIESIDFLDGIEIPFYKIPSGEITNKPYLQHIAAKGKDILLSTGMANLKEVKDAIEVIEAGGIARSRIIVLHCNTEYPTPMKDVNLLAMHHIANELGVKVGYSDHTMGIEVPTAAVALGAVVIEKHFTMDRRLPGPDHIASLEPAELKAMVSAIRNIEMAIAGSGIKEPSESEMKNISVGRKSVIAKRKINKGEVFSSENITTKRPGGGLSPMIWDEIIGKKAIRNFNENELIEL